MLLLDLTHTSHTHARTGVQRVCRALHAALVADGRATAITHDPFRRIWRPLASWEKATLIASAPSKKRSARWPLRVRLGGRLARLFSSSTHVTSPASRAAAPPAADGLIVPEIFSPAVAAAWPTLFARVRGPRVAIFYDAIALKFPELTPSKTVARFPAYLHELLAFDGVAAISEDSRQSLLDYWRWLGVAAHPPVAAIPLALDPPPTGSLSAVTPSAVDTRAAPPVILSVGTLEGRKNHLALLEACDALWRRGLDFELHVIGLAHAHTGRAALEKVRLLQASGRALRYDGPVDEPALHVAYARCAFTVYPSLYEGFGLPVLESLAHGKPCVCSAGGALGESARGGGCLMVARPDAASLTEALSRLLTSSEQLGALTAAARARVFKSWPDYAGEVVAWMETLRT
jgi:glycosyltransferase involved in cell wall biosynthesis